MSENDFTVFWFTAAGFLTLSYALFFWFAVRCGMLKDQDRARHLPLWAEVPEAPQFKVRSPEFGVQGSEFRVDKDNEDKEKKSY